MYTQADLARRFAAGYDSGAASNMTIEADADGTTHVLGYGWAVYASRSPGGTVTLHNGWDGYSPSTTQHLGYLRSVADTVDDETPHRGRHMGYKAPAGR